LAYPSEQMLAKYADLIVHVGLNLRAGQRLGISGAPLEAAPLARAVAAKAYDAGARLVEVNFADQQITLIRYQHAPRDSFEEFPEYIAEALERLLKEGGAILSINASDPDLLKDQDPALIGTAQKAAQKHMLPAMMMLTRNATNWCVASLPIPSWAAKVFPDLPPEQQMERLWDAILQVCRVDRPDPVADWKQHVAHLADRAKTLTAKKYTAFHYTGGGTDFTVGLPEGHKWMGGQITSENGIPFIPNLPTEEIFTLPHKDHADGVVRSSRPLSYGGKLIKDFSFTFKDGRVVDVSAAEGVDTLKELLDTDEGARRLGEVALVPYSSPISQSKILFYNTLFDENAASHLALGRAYAFTLQDGEQMDPDAFAAAGGNQSLTHVDFMIGTDQTDIDGIRADGGTEPVMRKGEWAFEI
jgi:aminopeptidase